MSEIKLDFGFQSDTDEELKSKGGNYGVFGLNTGYISEVFVDEEWQALKVIFKIGEGESTLMLFPITKIYYKNEVIEQSHPKYLEQFNKDFAHLKGVITHLLKIFYTEEQVKSFFGPNIKGFRDMFDVVVEKLKPFAKEENLVDIFLHYQWNIGKEATRTFLEIPRKVSDGYFLCKHMKPAGAWRELRNEEGLSYVDNNNNVHYFKRNKSFLETNRAKMQEEGSTTTVDMNTQKQNTQNLW